MSLHDYFKSKLNDNSGGVLFDSHCHLTWFDETEREQIVEQSLAAGVVKIIDIAVDLETSKTALANAQKFKGVVFPTAGIDPEVAVPGSDLFIEKLDSQKIETMLIELEKFVAENHQELIMIGECGLDYYWINKNKLSETEISKSKKLQQQIFAGQIELATKYKLPLSIHHRDSLDDCLELLERYGALPGSIKTSPGEENKVKAIFHSFTGGIEEAEKIVTSGFAIGINGIITYKSAENIRLAVKNVLTGKKVENPKELYQAGVFLETDAPFLLPRGATTKQNRPENIKLIYEYIFSQLTS